MIDLPAISPDVGVPSSDRPGRRPPGGRCPGGRRPGWPRLRHALPLLGLPIVIALVVRAVGGSSDLTRSLQLLRHPAPGWLGLAIGAEAVSYLSYAAAQRRLVRAAGQALSLPWLASLAVSAQALGNFLPAGYLAANVLNFRELRRRRLPGPRCAWVLVTTSLLYIGALAAVALVAVAVDEQGGPLAGGLRLGGLAILVTLLVLVGAIAASRRSARLRRRLPAIVSLIRARGGFLPRLLTAAGDLGRQASQVRISRRDAAAAAGLFGISWLSDAACLASGFLAVGATPVWTSVLMAYAAAQLVTFLPVTPGGLGLVEGSLTLALTTGGTGAGGILAGVLLYRGISYWATLPAGLAGYLGLRRIGARGPLLPELPDGSGLFAVAAETPASS